MTIEQLIDCPAADIEKLTDNELEILFGPALNITRPDRAQVQRNSKRLGSASLKRPDNAAKAAIMGMLAGMGVDLDDLD